MFLIHILNSLNNIQLEASEKKIGSKIILKLNLTIFLNYFERNRQTKKWSDYITKNLRLCEWMTAVLYEKNSYCKNTIFIGRNWFRILKYNDFSIIINSKKKISRNKPLRNTHTVLYQKASPLNPSSSSKRTITSIQQQSASDMILGNVEGIKMPKHISFPYFPHKKKEIRKVLFLASHLSQQQ